MQPPSENPTRAARLEPMLQQKYVLLRTEPAGFTDPQLGHCEFRSRPLGRETGQNLQGSEPTQGDRLDIV
jgi:hypothetical protein